MPETHRPLTSPPQAGFSRRILDVISSRPTPLSRSGAPPLNQHGVTLVNPAGHPHVKKDLGHALIDWIVSEEKQRVIAGYRIGGEHLFYPNARRG